MRHFIFPVVLFAMVAPYAEAAETGNIRGTVSDDTGTAIPGCVVTLSGSGIAGELQTTTDDDGNFRFLQIPPGQHSLLVVKQGVGQLKLKVTVRLDETSFAPVVLKVGSSAEITVEEVLPVIDTTRSAVSTQLTQEGLAQLPTGRSYQDVVNTLPGISGRVDTQNGGPGGGNPSVRGEGQYGNNYLVDGVSTRDPATKTFGTDVNFDAIEEIQVYTDGAPAEFGQATGMLVNVVTKDGGDEHHGSVAYYLGSSASWGTYDTIDYSAHMDTPHDKRTFLTNAVSLTAGGPIVKEKLWYFAALDAGIGGTKFEGMDPNAPQSTQSLGGFAKLSWFPTPDFTVRGQFNGQYSGINNYDTNSQVQADAQEKYNSDDLAGQLSVEWRPSDKNVLEIQGIYSRSHLNVVPMSGDEDQPMIQNLDDGTFSNNANSFDINARGRMGASVKFTQVVNRFAGSHRFKAGLELNSLKDSRELIYTGPNDGYEFDSQPSAGYNCTSTDNYATVPTDCAAYTEYQSVGALGHQGVIWSGFLQDDWSPIDVLTANIGVRADREQLYTNTQDLILDQWMFSPRLGASWDVTGDSKTQVAVNAGRYFDLNGNTFADWGDSKSAFYFAQYVNNGDGTYTNVYTQDPTGNPVIYCNKQSLAALKESSPETWQAIEDNGICDQDGDGKLDLKPYHMDKLVLGFKREIMPQFAIGLHGILSQTVDMPEDVDFDLDNWVVTSPESKRRDYRGLEFTAERKFDKHWQLLASYTLSESKGTMPGQFELASGGSTGSDGNQVGVYLDDVNDPATRATYFDAYGAGWLLNGLYGLGTTSDDAGYYGYLPYHSFHSVKVNGSYTFNFGTTVGLVYEFDSGHAYEKRGYVDLYQDYFAFPEGRGSRFMPAVHYFDFHVGHKLDLHNDKSLELTLDIFNLFDFQAPITYYENDDQNFGLTMYRQEPRSIRAGLKFTY